MLQVPINGQIAAVTLGATGGTTGESAPKIISRLSLTNSQMNPIKAQAALIVSEDLVKMGGGLVNRIFGRELAAAVAVQTDSQFLTELTSGLTPLNSSGNTATAILNDLKLALSQISVGVKSKIFADVPPDTAKYWATVLTGQGAYPNYGIAGGDLFGVTVVPTEGIASNQIVLFDASQVAANSGTLIPSMANYATVQMETAPDSPPLPTTSMVSLWQSNLVGFRLERWFGVERLGTSAAALVQNVANSPA